MTHNCVVTDKLFILHCLTKDTHHTFCQYVIKIIIELFLQVFFFVCLLYIATQLGHKAGLRPSVIRQHSCHCTHFLQLLFKLNYYQNFLINLTIELYFLLKSTKRNCSGNYEESRMIKRTRVRFIHLIHFYFKCVHSQSFYIQPRLIVYPCQYFTAKSDLPSIC